MSSPSTPLWEMPPLRDSRFKPISAPCERADSYRPGGFHPVHFQDVLLERYRVIRKLGYGSFATVWFAVDSVSSTYVALKIHTANLDASNELSIQQHLKANSPRNSDSNFVLLLSDSFVLECPNGKHHCFVTKPMGPSISAVLNAPPKFYDPLNPPGQRFPMLRSKSFLRNVLIGLKFLHNNHVVHGDLQPGNLMFSLKDLTALNPGELEQNETNSKIDPLLRIDGKVDRWAPKYLAVSELLKEESLSQDEQVLRLADLAAHTSEAFWVDKPSASIVTPLALRAPETVLHGRVGPAIDIWSFGCIMSELLTDNSLFELFTFVRQNDVIDDDHLIQLSEILGPLPKDMLAKWSRYSSYFGPSGERLAARPSAFDKSQIGRAIQEKSRNPGPPASFPSLEDKFYEYKPSDINDMEAKEIAYLLRDMLQIDPLKRPSAAQLLRRSWFLI